LKEWSEVLTSKTGATMEVDLAAQAEQHG
jgi:hypothetical protein